MKLKKIMAGTMGAIMLASVIPTAVMAEEEADEYIYRETFDNDSYDSIFDTASSASWQGARVMEENNGYMKYNYSDASDAGDGKNFIDADLGIKLEPDTCYELGFKFKYNTTFDNLRISMPIKTSAGKELNSSATAFVYTYPGSTKGRWNGNDQWFELDTYARDTKWATMKIRMITDDKGRTIQYFTDRNGTSYCSPNPTNNYACWGRTLGGQPEKVFIRLGGAKKISYESIENGIDSYEGGRGVFIDDVYVKKINKNPTVYFEMNGHGGESYSETSEYNMTLSVPTPSEDGYEFMGWYEDEEMTQKVKVSDNKKTFFKDCTIYAKWAKACTVTFDTNGGAFNDGSTQKKVKTTTGTITMISEKPKRTGYIFDGWFDEDGNEFVPTGITDNMLIKAKWTRQYTITFDSQGGTAVSPIKTTETFIELPKAPTKVRHEFDGWYTDSECTVPFDEKNITDDLTVYAKWVEAYEISFESNGGNAVAPIYTVKGLPEDEELPEAEKFGYRFDGWFSDEELKVPFDGHNVTGDIKVYAAWTKKYIVSFETNGGKAIDPIYTLDDIKKLPISSKTYFKFDGWYLDEELTEPFDGTGITGDMTVYAKWIEGESDPFYLVDFEDGLPHGFQARGKDVASGYWQSEIVNDGTNSYMRYYRNPDIGVADTYSSFIDNTVEGLDLDPNVVYEIGYKLAFNKSMIRLSKVLNLDIYDQSNNVDLTAMQHQTQIRRYMLDGITIDADYDQKLPDVDGFIDIRQVVNAKKGTKVTYYSYYDEYGKLHEGQTKEIAITSKAKSWNGRIHWYNARLYDKRDWLKENEIWLDDVYIRFYKLPSINGYSIEDGAADVSVNPEIDVYFSTTMDRETLGTGCITITDDNGNTIPETDYSFASMKKDGKTVGQLRFLKKLDYNTSYTLDFDRSMTDGKYYIDKDYSLKFKTVPLTVAADAELTDVSGNKVTDLKAYAGQSVTASVNMRNYAGKDSETYFVGVALVDEATGKQLFYDMAVGQVAKGDAETIIKASIPIPADVTDTYKVNYYLMDGTETRNILSAPVVLPQ